MWLPNHWPPSKSETTSVILWARGTRWDFKKAKNIISDGNVEKSCSKRRGALWCQKRIDSTRRWLFSPPRTLRTTLAPWRSTAEVLLPCQCKSDSSEKRESKNQTDQKSKKDSSKPFTLSKPGVGVFPATYI
jgi:hypothetical protein